MIFKMRNFGSNNDDDDDNNNNNTLPEKCNSFKDKFIVLRIDVTGSLSL